MEILLDRLRLTVIDVVAKAKANDCPLLYVGNDFAQTDIRSALG
jgi:uncharacterized protein with PIN domain